MADRETEIALRKIVEKMKQRRIASGLSHQKLADKIGVTRPAISYMESGKRKPGFDLVLKVCKGLDIKLEDILRDIN